MRSGRSASGAAQPAAPPSRAMVYFVGLATTLFAVVHIDHVFQAAARSDLSLPAIALLALETLVEVGASAYVFTLLFIAAAYWRKDAPPPAWPPASHYPPVGIVYLCCDDFDQRSFQSLARLKYRGKLHLIVHDDSRVETHRAEVDRAVESLQRQSNLKVHLLRRPTREGGKAGASNNVLVNLAGLAEYFLVCDNDSTVLDPLAIEKALPYFDDPGVAIVQGRNIAGDHSRSCFANRLLAKSINAFHAFMNVYARFGWKSFIGHGAFLRSQAVLEVGGFTPGFFSDDLDLTVRLNLKGYKVIYAPEIQFGEQHPASYAAFRRRSYKWAYGCMQTLRAHAWRVLASPRFTVAEKLSFFQLTTFYVAQTIMLLYLMAACWVAPFVLRAYPFSGTSLALPGLLIILAIYLPLLSYFGKEKERRGWSGAVLLCGLVYGCSDFPTAYGVWDCLRRRKRAWTPTNTRSREGTEWGLVAEAFFGASLLGIPLLTGSPWLYAPCLYLFAGKFLFGPALALLYDDDRAAAAVGEQALRVAQIASVLALLSIPAFVSHPLVHAASVPGVKIRGKEIAVDGRPFLVKGMNYGPWRPGTGPGKNYPYPSPQEIDSDLKQIQQLNVNTILVYDPPGYVLDLAQKYGLKVLYTFDINWWTFGTPQEAAQRESILKRVAEYRDKPALLGWVLGNEIPTTVVDQRGKAALTDAMLDLYRSVKAIDPLHPITHCNWTETKDLDFSFLDIISFNVYPLWPPEVVAMGYGNYIKNELQPIAGDKPLLITEFGADTIEAGEQGQARLIRNSWEGLLNAGACGGVVFEFADEWWKNYDNPRRPGDWWDRVKTPDDEKTHDLDPEEYYGVMTAERQPRPAAATVREMYSTTSAERIKTVPALASSALVLLAIGSWVWAKHRNRESTRPMPPQHGQITGPGVPRSTD